MNERYKRIIAMFFALNILFEVISPTLALALTGGPSQPEVQSFTPVSTSDMVNLFTGDFNYNIPLLDIDGYPLNLAYNAGVSNDQEASWVGLGWNINPGTVNRGLRGLPDDFKGDLVRNETNMKANQTFGASYGLGIELFGKDKKAGNGIGNLNLSLGLNYNTYAGYGMEMGAKLSLSQNKNNQTGFNGSLGLSSGTGKGLGITANVGYQKNFKDKAVGNKTMTTRANGSLGLNYNTSAGLSGLTFAYSVSRQKETTLMTFDDGSKLVERKNGSSNGGFGYSFASPTYMPSSGSPEMVNLGLSLSVSFGAEFVGAHPKGTIGAYYSGQFIKDKTKDFEAYGYLYSERNNSRQDPENSSNKLHDFNREKDASFTMNTPNLPVTNYSFDSFNYTGQGISGDFRPYRSQLGTVFDPYVKNFPSLNGSVGVEIGGGNAVHGGVNAELSFSRTKTGKWTERNNVEQNTLFTDANLGLYEGVYFKQGGEKTAETDMNYFNNVINGFQPVRLGLLEAGAETYLTKDLTTKYGATKVISNNGRAGRVRRNEAVNVLKASEASVMGLETSIKTYQLNDFSSFYSSSGLPTAIARAGGNYKDHHISEISTLRDDGARYVYGIPVYNNINKEVTFAVEPSISASNYDNGLVTYGGTDNTSNNTKGLDNFFDSQKMDPYAHAFLLTGVLSSDYVDKTLNGPTRDDLGKYTKFNYTRYATNYRWRSPYGASANAASLNQALYSSSGAAGDDKASYSYGEKELWYMHSIETKNYVAVFELEDRQDALGVLGENGGKDPAQKTQRLKEIRLYTKQELIDKAANAVPLKVVHFEYDYSLCPGIHNSSTNLGKLTLKKVWFSYQKSWKGKLSPYVFEYNTANTATNYNYNPKAYDRWGNYKPNSPSTVPGGYGGTNSSDAYLLSSEFPYSEQDPTKANLYAAAWNLSRITLPSGAQINVNYEADDYAYVQNKKAMQMFTMAGADFINSSVSPSNTLYDLGQPLNPNKEFMYVNISSQEANEINLISPSATQLAFIRNKYFKDENGNDIDYVYFKFLLNVERNLTLYNKKYEYVSGYAKIDFSIAPTLNNGKIVFKVVLVPVYDNIPSNNIVLHPVSMAGINFVRRYMPRVAFDNNQDPFSSAGSNLLALAQGMKAAFTPIVQFFKGGLSNALRLSKASQEFVPSRSFVRLYSGRQSKKGGGSRVQRILLSDNWSIQSTNPAISDANYGQIYDYVTKDTDGRTISSGVASYEPLIGGDENPFRRPVFYEEKHILAPDDDYYHEEPYGEAMFPGPVVGYSRVLVRNLQNINGSVPVSRHATGAIVHEFYTAKDFPTKTDRTDLKKIRHKPNPIAKAFKFSVRDFMTTSQGYQVVLNDMHGKQKAQWVYKEANSASLLIGTSRNDYYGNNYISGIEYKYKRNLDDLSNDVPVIEKTGQLATAMVGVDYDMVVDTRESLTTTRNGTTQGNLEAFLLAIFPGLVPTVFPGYSQEKTRYRSAVVTKVLYRYGLVDEIISYNDGASVSVKNKLWDAETGEVLLTQTANNFSDPMYNFTYPAHWAYDRMGNAAKNSNAQSAITSGNISTPSILIVGDEVLLYGSANARGWVKATQPTVQIIDNTGATMNLSSFTSLSVIRSGNRNQQNMPVAQLVSLENPLQQSGNVTNLVINKGTKVINAGASEYKDGWGIFCNCGITASSVVNPFLTGQAGIFRANASYVYLTGREQTKKNDNTNIRKDGPYLSFASFWQPNTSAAPYNWIKTTDPAWQYTNKTTLYSPYGFELENIDALNRSSAAIYGYGNTLPIAVSSNAKYKQIAFDGFEDYDYNTPCDDSRFTFMGTLGSGSNPTIQYYNFSTYNFISKPNSQNQKYAHTGRKSFKVQPSGTVITNQINPNYICTPATTPYFHK